MKNQIILFNENYAEAGWELNQTNIEKHRNELNWCGKINIEAFDENGITVESEDIGPFNIADGLYDALKEIQNLIAEYGDFGDINVFYYPNLF